MFDNAEFVLGTDERPPHDSAAWAPVSLPDEWRRTTPGFAGQGWYRIEFEFARAPATMHAILLAYLRSHRVDFFVNGNLVGGSRDVTMRNAAGTLLGHAVYLTVPPHLLQAGKNVIHVRMLATSAAAALHGLGQVTFGEAREVRKGYIRHLEQEAQAFRIFLAMAFAAGLIALCLWLARRGDRVMLLLAITYLSWAFTSALLRPLLWLESPPTIIRDILLVHLSYGLPPLSVLLCLRTASLRWPRFEKAVLAYLAAVVTLPLWGSGGGEEWRLAVDGVNTLLLLAGAAIIAFHAERPLRWSVNLQLATLFLMGAFILSEYMRYFGWVNPDTLIIRHYHILVMIVGFGTAFFADHVLSVWRAQKTNVELERLVAEKAREIETNHARVEEAMREQTLARERQRIITDMHDGLGASLIALLRSVQAERGDPYIEQRVKEALQELRIAIDALEPSEGNLGAVLGNLRYRLEPLLEPAGLHLEWEVTELPRIEALEPTTVFALQRIVLEAVANALKHSGASRVRLSAHAAPGGGVEIRVEDDGRGFDTSHPSLGTGLRNMRLRAARIGVQLEIS
ncbi:MAG: ATP-binding protein, partial [Betaproteobacteria bacterium]